MLTIQEIILIFALIGVLGGWAMGRIGSWFDNRKSGGRISDDQRIRGLEADLRVVQRKAEEAELTVERNREQIEEMQREMQAKTNALAERDKEIEHLRRSLSDECVKTKNLRHELTSRAEETIRASVRVKDAETELSVARAGSDAVLEQIQALAAEREQLTGRLRILQAEAASRGQRPKVTQFPLRDPKER